MAVAVGEDELFRKQYPKLDFLAKPVSPGLHIKIKGRVLNGWGIFYALTTYIVAAITLPFMFVGAILSDLFGYKKV